MKPHDRPVTHRVTATPALQGERIDKALAALIPSVSRRQIRDILVRGGVWNGIHRIRSQCLPVAAGDVLVLVHPPGFIYPEVHLTAAHILWEDPWLVALNKEAGWYVQPNPWDVFGNVEQALIDFLQTREGKKPRLHLTHRLDRDTSGVLIVSRSPDINAQLQKLWNSGGVEKIYRALVSGHPQAEWSCSEPLGPGPNAKHRVDAVKGKPAHTDFKTLRTAGSAEGPWAEIEARPRTGRTHQIRIHAAHTGHPLLGDPRYGGPEQLGGRPVSRVMLHAASLTLRHPKTGEAIRLEAPVPADYAALQGTS